MTERRLEYMPIGQLVPNPDNPKDHDLNELRESVARLGYIEPAVLDERTGQLVSGHGRTELLIAAQLDQLAPPDGVTVDDEGTWLVPVVRGWASTDDDEARAALVALNAIGEGLWHDEKLAPLLSSLRATWDGLSGVGFDDGDLTKLLQRVGNEELPRTGESEDVPANYMVVIDCTDEDQQSELLDKLSAEGLTVRALVS